MNNEYLEYYAEHKISPVRQNIDDFERHIHRRRVLLRQLGITPLSIKDRSILEVGCGGGYNALANYTFHPSKYTFVEPNKTGFDELKKNFKEKSFDQNLFFYNTTLEQFHSQEQFDIVFCEGLIQGLNNKEQFVNFLKSYVQKDGILVITVADEISVFFEMVRRLFANEVIKNQDNFNEKIESLVNLFQKDLSSLKGMSRLPFDWCADLMCDAYYYHTISIEDVLDMCSDQFYFLGSSPNIFQDSRWYKAISDDTLEYNKIFKEQFNYIRHSLILSHLDFQKRDLSLNDELSFLTKEFMKLVQMSEIDGYSIYRESLRKLVTQLKENLLGIDDLLDNALKDLSYVVQKENISADDILQLKYLPLCFGKGQVFLSFIKR